MQPNHIPARISTRLSTRFPPSSTASTAAAQADTEAEAQVDADAEASVSLPSPVSDTPTRAHPHSHPQRRRLALLVLLFFVFGIAMLSPWNTWITAAPFFRVRLEGSAFTNNFQSYFSVSYMLTNLVSLGLLLHFQDRVDATARVTVGFLLAAVVFSMAASMAQFETLDPTIYFFESLALIVVSGLASALLAGLMGFAAMYPSIFVTAMVSGQGMAGVVPAVSQLILITLASNSTQDQAEDNTVVLMQSYFSISIAISLVSLFGFRYLCSANAAAAAATTAIAEYEHIEPDSPEILASEQPFPRSTVDINQYSHDEASLLPLASSQSPEPDTDLVSGFDSDAESGFNSYPIGPNVSIMELTPHIRPLVIAMLLNFSVTLALFPALTSSILSTSWKPVSNSDDWHPSMRAEHVDLFVPIHFLIFNLGDMVGKSLPMIPRLSSFSQQTLTQVAYLRLLFFPLLLFCNVITTDRLGNPVPRTLPLLFGDAAYFCILALLGLTGGWLSTLLFIAAPVKVARSTLAERPGAMRLAGDAMVVALTTGLVIGSTLSFVLRWAICDCNPFIS